MFARLLILTKAYQLAAQQAALPRRTVVKLTQAEWDELNEDAQFKLAYAGKDYVEMNGVVITILQPVKLAATSDTAARADTPHG